MEKKKAILLTTVIFGLAETILSALIILFVVPDMERLDNLVKSNFFNPNLVTIFYTFTFLIGLIQFIWGWKEYKKKKPHISKILIYKGILLSVLMLISLYYFLLFPLERMVVASY